MRMDYPVLPFISYGKLKGDNGMFISLPFKGISLNDYKQMHHGKVSKERGHFKSILDVVFLSCIKKSYFTKFDETGLHIKSLLFQTKIDVEWVLSFGIERSRDTANYTQKILLDAIVDTGIITDDCDEFVRSDKCFFSNKDFDSVTCILRGKTNPNYFIKSTIEIGYDELLTKLGVENE